MKIPPNSPSLGYYWQIPEWQRVHKKADLILRHFENAVMGDC